MQKRCEWAKDEPNITYHDKEWGLELKVTKPCDEEDCDLICCSKQMSQS